MKLKSAGESYAEITSIAAIISDGFDEVPEVSMDELANTLRRRVYGFEDMNDLPEFLADSIAEWRNMAPEASHWLTCSQWVAVKLYERPATSK